MSRTHVLLLAALLLVTGADGRLKRLTATERTHYQALQVWLDKADKKAFFKLKTPEARDQFLKDKGLWAKFYDLPKDKREAVSAGDVRVGWTRDMVLMAWGTPVERRNLAVPTATRSELLVYLVEVTADGEALLWVPGSKETHGSVDRYRWEIEIHDGKVVDKRKKAGWP